jgi:hypothetical protein
MCEAEVRHLPRVTPQLLLTILLLGNLPMLRGAVATMERITKDNKSRPTFEK